MTDKEKFEPAGYVHKFFGEQVPDGFYWVLVDAKYNANEPTGFAGTPDSWFVDQWRGAILGKESEVIKPSPKGTPVKGGSFTSYDGSPKNMYSLTLKCFETLEEAEEFVKIGQYEKYPKYDWTWRESSTENIDFVKKTQKIRGIKADRLWFDESEKIASMSWNTFNPPTEEEIEKKRITQRQVDLNSAKITKLEKELKDLRELQKLLKGMR